MTCMAVIWALNKTAALYAPQSYVGPQHYGHMGLNEESSLPNPSQTPNVSLSVSLDLFRFMRSNQLVYVRILAGVVRGCKVVSDFVTMMGL